MGNFKAWIDLGYMYSPGIGVLKDTKKTYECFQKALDYANDDIDTGITYYNLGLHYEFGEAVEQDYNKAVEYYQKAAALNDKDAIKRLETFKKTLFGKWIKK